MPNRRHQHDTEHTTVQANPEVARPPMFRVIIHNDDYTPKDFVVMILHEIFHRPVKDAHQIMLQVHTRGFGVAGIYPYEIAETKVHRVHQLAIANGHPLKCSVESD